MSQTQTIQVYLNAAIPRGNRVSITFFRKQGFFSSSIDEQEPLIEDLDTGITYGQPWHLKKLVVCIPFI